MYSEIDNISAEVDQTVAEIGERLVKHIDTLSP